MLKRPIDPKLISIRDLSEKDIPLILDYWYRSPPGYIDSMGVDSSKLQPEPVFEKTLQEKCRQNPDPKTSKLNALVIDYENEPVGFHAINPVIEGNFGVFHAHLWKPELRGRGLAFHTYAMACRLFLKRFNLNRILFKTPIQNAAAIRVKEKLGIRCIGQETVTDFGIIKNGTLVQVFELTRKECEAPSHNFTM